MYVRSDIRDFRKMKCDYCVLASPPDKQIQYVMSTIVSTIAIHFVYARRRYFIMWTRTANKSSAVPTASMTEIEITSEIIPNEMKGEQRTNNSMYNSIRSSSGDAIPHGRFWSSFLFFEFIAYCSPCRDWKVNPSQPFSSFTQFLFQPFELERKLPANVLFERFEELREKRPNQWTIFWGRCPLQWYFI